MTAVWGIVVAAGRGRRYGGPKQFEPLGGQRVVDWSLAVTSDSCRGVVLVVAPELVEHERKTGGVTVVAGGATRSESVRAGLAAVPESADVVVVHDAARPLASAQLFAAVIAAVRNGADAAVPGVPVKDSLKRVDGERVVETVERDGLVAVQTPQAFRAPVLRAAHAVGGEATDDAAFVERAGGVVVVVAGEPRNVKITTADDLDELRRAVR